MSDHHDLKVVDSGAVQNNGSPVSSARVYFSPSALKIGDTTYVFYNSPNNDGNLMLVKSTPSGWGSPTMIPNVILNDSPGAIFNEKTQLTYVFHQGSANTNTQNQLWYSVMAANGEWLKDRQIPGIHLNNAPSPVMHGNYIRVFYQSTNNNEMRYVDVQ